MSKKFRYTKFTKYHYCEFSDEWEEDGVEFDYEVEDEDLLPEIVDLVFEEYFSDRDYNEDLVKEKLQTIIYENDLIVTFADQYEERLKDIFEKEAMEWYND